jgi:hypothetical protein
MRRKNFTPLIVILVLLAGAAFLLANPFQKQETDETGAVVVGKDASSSTLLVDVKQDDITAISIKPPTDPEFKLVKEDAGWFATQGEKRYRADQERVDKLLEALPGLRSESLATENEKKYADMGINDTEGIKVGVYTSGKDKPAVTLIAGKAAPGYATSFVQVENQKQVWRATQNIKSLVGFTYRDYRTKAPWKFDPSTVTELTVRPVNGKPDTYKSEGGVWKTASGANANQNLITTLLHDWSEAVVSDFDDSVEPGVTPFDTKAENTDPGDVGKDSAGMPVAVAHKVGQEPNLVAVTPQGKFSFTLGVKDAGLYFVADQDGLVYKASEPQIKFFRELRFAELKIAAAEKSVEAMPEGGKSAEGEKAVPDTATSSPK